MDSIGIRIKKLRESNGLTSEQFGKIAGVSKGAVSQWEGNSTEPKAKALMYISHHFNISIDYLLFGDEGIKQTNKLEKLVTKMINLEKQGALTNDRIDLIENIIDSWKTVSESDKEAQKTA